MVLVVVCSLDCMGGKFNLKFCDICYGDNELFHHIMYQWIRIPPWRHTQKGTDSDCTAHNPDNQVQIIHQSCLYHSQPSSANIISLKEIVEEVIIS